MSSGKTRKKSFSSLVSPMSPTSALGSTDPGGPLRSPQGSDRSGPNAPVPPPSDFFSVERGASIEEEMERQIHVLRAVIHTWKTRWRNENEEKVRQLRKKDTQVLSQRTQMQKLLVSRDRVIKEKHSLERQFKRAVKQHSMEKFELQTKIKDLKEESKEMIKVIESQNQSISDLKAKLDELSELNNNACLNPRCKGLKEQCEALKQETIGLKSETKMLKTEARMLNLKLKEGDLRDENYNVLIQTSLDRIRTLEAQTNLNSKPRRGCLGGRYVVNTEHLGELQAGILEPLGGRYVGNQDPVGGRYVGNQDSLGGRYVGNQDSLGGRYVGNQDSLGGRYTGNSDHVLETSDVSVSASVPSACETRSLGSLDSLESILEDVCIQATESEKQANQSVPKSPLQVSRSSADLLQPMLNSSPDLNSNPPVKYPLQRKGSLDFERLSPQRRKRLSGFEFLKPRQNNNANININAPNHNTQAPPREGKRKRRTAEFADLLRKIANGGTNASGLDHDKRHNVKGSRPKWGSLKH